MEVNAQREVALSNGNDAGGYVDKVQVLSVTCGLL